MWESIISPNARGLTFLDEVSEESYMEGVTENLVAQDGDNLDMFAWYCNGSIYLKWEDIFQLVVEEQAKRDYQRIFIEGDCRDRVQYLYNHNMTQLFFASLIAANFIWMMFIKQVDVGREVEYNAEIFFVLGFWIDLIWNMCGNLGRTGHRYGFFDFFNVLDIFLVAVGTVGVFYEVGFVFMLVRLLRIAKLGGKFRKLGKYITMVRYIVLPVVMGLGLVFLISCIYALIAIEIYNGKGPKSSAEFKNFSSSLQMFLEFFTVTGWNRYFRDLRPEIGNWSFAFFFTYIILCAIIVRQIMGAVFFAYLGHATADQQEADRKEFFSTIFRFIDKDGEGSIDHVEFMEFVLWLKRQGYEYFPSKYFMPDEKKEMHWIEFMLRAESLSMNTSVDASMRTLVKFYPYLTGILDEIKGLRSQMHSLMSHLHKNTVISNSGRRNSIGTTSFSQLQTIYDSMEASTGSQSDEISEASASYQLQTVFDSVERSYESETEEISVASDSEV